MYLYKSMRGGDDRAIKGAGKKVKGAKYAVINAQVDFELSSKFRLECLGGSIKSRRDLAPLFSAESKRRGNRNGES